MGSLQTEITALTSHCDLEARLRAVPPSTRVRGLYFKSAISALTDAGKIAPYRELFPEDYSAVRWYPMTEYLVRLAVAGALLESPEQIHHGMYEIGRRNASAFSDSLIGRTMLRLLARDPSRLLRQACAARRQSIEGGRWDVEFTSERRAEVSMHAEYVWIESNLVGAAVGTFESIGLGVTVEYELTSPYEGKHVLTW